MTPESQSLLSKNKLRRLQGWAKSVYPQDWNDRCAAISQYVLQLDYDSAESLINQGWATVAAEAEREWPEAFPAPQPQS